MATEELKIVISGQNSDLTAKIRQSEKDLCNLGESAEKTSDGFRKADKRIADILANTERTCGSKAASIAAILRQQGMSQSESFTEAWSMIERNVSDKTDSVSRKVSSGTEDVKRSIKRSNDDIKNSVKGVGETAEPKRERSLQTSKRYWEGTLRSCPRPQQRREILQGLSTAPQISTDFCKTRYKRLRSK